MITDKTQIKDIVNITDERWIIGNSYVLQVGQTAQGTLSADGARDIFSVSLVASQTYTFAMVGTGAFGVPDPYLWVYSPSSVAVAVNDDGLQNIFLLH